MVKKALINKKKPKEKPPNHHHSQPQIMIFKDAAHGRQYFP